ncbi:GH25 family lysozyme [Clostridium pasteurianum]|uniref:Lysozyme M1 (1,4-beta-N-acetylmuramidase) n=1 Tax=Clostridium pasteurianum BC1 TaxID=86416 RepID=R4K3B5_CLOPA|nr:GH25 family lysozyme [Clostridium pasteurianum]AGK97617.1 lysozyme M1 (1,4-beta-N-acetylmuramidase) [Clostridium pasteurianum BC1]
MKGIDISPYQGNINFQAAKNSGIEIVYIKSTEGRTWQSETFRNYYNQAINCGLKVGVYHFLRANAMIDEVNNLLSMISGLHFDCKIAIDCEVILGQSKQQITSNIRQFHDILKSKGYDSVLYTYSSFLQDNIDYSQLTDVEIWIANYGHNPSVTNQIGWQYSETGSVNGISGNCDLDDFSEGILIGGSNAPQAININNIQGSVTMNPIKQGENSGRVRLLQSILSVLIGGITIDGAFGQQTYSAVIKYQQIMHLVADGVVGINTITTLLSDIQHNWFKA